MSEQSLKKQKQIIKRQALLVAAQDAAKAQLSKEKQE